MRRCLQVTTVGSTHINSVEFFTNAPQYKNANITNFVLADEVSKLQFGVCKKHTWQIKDFSDVGRQPQRWWRQLINLATFSQYKLHENETKMGRNEGGCPWRPPPLDPPMQCDFI